jgi:chromosomal replication initiation ATPase DnaA
MVDLNNQVHNHLYKSTISHSTLSSLSLVVLVGDAGVGKTHLLHR